MAISEPSFKQTSTSEYGATDPAVQIKHAFSSSKLKEPSFHLTEPAYGLPADPKMDVR